MQIKLISITAIWLEFVNFLTKSIRLIKQRLFQIHSTDDANRRTPPLEVIDKSKYERKSSFHLPSHVRVVK